MERAVCRWPDARPWVGFGSNGTKNFRNRGKGRPSKVETCEQGGLPLTSETARCPAGAIKNGRNRQAQAHTWEKWPTAPFPGVSSAEAGAAPPALVSVQGEHRCGADSFWHNDEKLGEVFSLLALGRRGEAACPPQGLDRISPPVSWQLLLWAQPGSCCAERADGLAGFSSLSVQLSWPGGLGSCWGRAWG